MINVTKLYCDVESKSDPLRYGAGHGAPTSAGTRRPVVVWTMTRRCNLKCLHCYTDSENRCYPGELTMEEAVQMLDDLTTFKIPALLLSGGEPLMHPNFFEIAQYAKMWGLRLTLSTNGTLITQDMAKRIAALGPTYAGISFDGLYGVNDRFRGMDRAFRKALGGLIRLKELGQRVGLRFTLTRRNIESLPGIFEMVEREGIDRVCFYHLVYAGRGRHLAQDDLPPAEMRQAIDTILLKTRELVQKGWPGEVLTVDNHADGVFIYLTLVAEGHHTQAEKVYQWLTWNGGGANSSGVGIAHIDAQGNVHPDQFWQEVTFGNVRGRPFSQIWQDESHPMLKALRDRLPLLKGRCGSCQWKPLCGGAFRVRAQFTHGDPWASDPACYLTDEEIGCAQK